MSYFPPLLIALTQSGFCFGHQVIAKALGLSVKRGDFEVSVTTIHLTSIGKAIFNTDKLVRPTSYVHASSSKCAIRE